MEKRLYRSYKNKMIGGVAAGLGEYFSIDTVLIRIIFIVTTLISGIGLIAYILLWIIVPYETLQPAAQTSVNTEQAGEIPIPGENSKNRVSILGIILIIIGCLFLADNFIPFFRFHDIWPLVLVAIGIGLILKSPKK